MEGEIGESTNVYFRRGMKWAQKYKNEFSSLRFSFGFILLILGLSLD